MSRVLITDSHLSGIADAIRAKNGSQTEYKPGEMAAAIMAIDSGGIVPTGTVTINANGLVDVTQYENANVNVQPNLQSKTATENGVVTPDSGYDGLSSVLVDVGGEPSLPVEYQRVQYLDFTPSIGIIIEIPTAGSFMYTVNFSSDISDLSTAFGYRLKNGTNEKDFEVAISNGKRYTWVRSSGNANGTGIGANNETYTIGERVEYSILLVSPRATAHIGKYFDSNNTGSLDGKFYELKGIDVTGSIAAWFVPCYRKSDNQVGVYDHVAQHFFSETIASGSSYSIIAGPDVE